MKGQRLDRPEEIYLATEKNQLWRVKYDRVRVRDVPAKRVAFELFRYAISYETQHATSHGAKSLTTESIYRRRYVMLYMVCVHVHHGVVSMVWCAK